MGASVCSWNRQSFVSRALQGGLILTDLKSYKIRRSLLLFWIPKIPYDGALAPPLPERCT